MSGDSPRLTFLSLFVPDLEDAAQRYEAILGVAPSSSLGSAPQGHPFAAAGPVVFELGEVALALYQCDQRATHPGDVGIGIEGEAGTAGAVAARARTNQGQVFFGPRAISPDDAREMSVFVLPDRHFFEVVG